MASGNRVPSDLRGGTVTDPVALAALELLEDSMAAGSLDGTPWLEIALGPDGLNIGRRRRRGEADDAQRVAGSSPFHQS